MRGTMVGVVVMAIVFGGMPCALAQGNQETTPAKHSWWRLDQMIVGGRAEKHKDTNGVDASGNRYVHNTIDQKTADAAVANAAKNGDKGGKDINLSTVSTDGMKSGGTLHSATVVKGDVKIPTKPGTTVNVTKLEGSQNPDGKHRSKIGINQTTNVEDSLTVKGRRP